MQWMPLALELARRDLVRRGARSLFVEVDGRRMHYLDLAGRWDGPPVVLLHGLGGTALGWSRCLFALAGRSMRVVAPDLPGAGFSPVPPAGPLGLDALIDCFERFFAQEIGRPAVVVGNSLGGAMAARFAARHPGSVAALVLVSPAGARVAPGRMEEVSRNHAVRTNAQARALMHRLFHRPPLGARLLAPALREQLDKPAVHRLLEEAARAPGLEPGELEGLAAPTLLLWGRSERLLPYEGIGYFRAHLPEAAEIDEVEGFGHCPQLERPRELSRRILAFLERRAVVRAG